jgi:hypothetical protein
VFPHSSIHKYTWPSRVGKSHNQIHHVLIDKRGHFREVVCDTDHYLVAAGVKRFSISKQAAQKFDMKRFNLKKQKDVEVKE